MHQKIQEEDGGELQNGNIFLFFVGSKSKREKKLGRRTGKERRKKNDCSGF